MLFIKYTKLFGCLCPSSCSRYPVLSMVTKSRHLFINQQSSNHMYSNHLLSVKRTGALCPRSVFTQHGRCVLSSHLEQQHCHHQKTVTPPQELQCVHQNAQHQKQVTLGGFQYVHQYQQPQPIITSSTQEFQHPPWFSHLHKLAPCSQRFQHRCNKLFEYSQGRIRYNHRRGMSLMSSVVDSAPSKVQPYLKLMRLDKPIGQ